MSHKIIGIAHSSDANIAQAVSKQLEFIKSNYPDIIVEQGDETHALFIRHARRPDRFPCFIIMKGDACKNRVHAKFTNADLLDWIKAKLGV